MLEISWISFAEFEVFRDSPVGFCISIFSWAYCFSLFLDSADIYSSFVFAQLVCSMLHLACTTFQLDLVFFNATAVEMLPKRSVQWEYIFFPFNFSKFTSLITDWYFCCKRWCSVVPSCSCMYNVLLLRWNGHDEFWTICRRFVRVQLAKLTIASAKMLYFNDRECAATALLPWIPCLHSESEYICSSNAYFELFFILHISIKHFLYAIFAAHQSSVHLLHGIQDSHSQMIGPCDGSEYNSTIFGERFIRFICTKLPTIHNRIY